MSLLPSEPETASGEAGPQVIDFDDDLDSVFSVLRSDTSRTILSTLYEESAAASEIANRVDTSLQNANHHLSNLREAGLVEVVGTGYSEKGREMKIYAPAGNPLALVIGPEEQTQDYHRALDQLDPGNN